VIIGGWRGPGWRITDADPGQARQVRDWIRAAITRHDCPVDPADAALAASELYANAVMFFLLCFHVAIAAIGGKRTCGLCCSTTSSSLPLVTEPRETGQPATGQGQLRHGYHRTRRVRREVAHGPAGGRVLAGYCLWSAGARIVVCDGGGPGTPRMRPGAGLAEGGRGLAVVDSVAARWGSFRLSGAQVVWCDFGQPLRAPASDAWAWLACVLSACPLSAPAPQPGHAPAPTWPAGRQPPHVPVPAGLGNDPPGSLAARPARSGAR